MGHNSVVSGYPKSTRILWVDGLSTGDPGFWGIIKAPQQDGENQIVVLRGYKPYVAQDDEKNTPHKMIIIL